MGIPPPVALATPFLEADLHFAREEPRCNGHRRMAPLPSLIGSLTPRGFQSARVGGPLQHTHVQVKSLFLALMLSDMPA